EYSTRTTIGRSGSPTAPPCRTPTSHCTQTTAEIRLARTEQARIGTYAEPPNDVQDPHEE
ncbi:unnamed protein product, partial [Prorocentrum cordatum]